MRFLLGFLLFYFLFKYGYLWYKKILKSSNSASSPNVSSSKKPEKQNNDKANDAGEYVDYEEIKD